MLMTQTGVIYERPNSKYKPALSICWSLLQVRLPLLPVDFLTGTVAKDEMIQGSLSCRDLMDEARNYHLHLSNKVVADFEYSARTIPRKHTAGSTCMITFQNM